MKKSYNIGTDIKISDGVEVTRRLYRNITEIAKKLEEQKSSALTVIDVFTPTGEALRSKLRDYCERLIVNDPGNHVQKTEELLWRRGFYDIVSAAKKLRKGNSWNDMEKAFLSAHLSVGVGFYHHLILRLQSEYDLNLMGIVDFAYSQKQREERVTSSTKATTAEAKNNVLRLVHRSLICLGDLARYRLDLDHNWDPQIATRYYKMAIAMDSKYGMPHNQLGTVANNRNYGLDAVYHYMRSTLCQEPFDGAEGNLKRTIIIHSFTGKEKCLTQCCVARLLLLLQLWDNNSINFDPINQESQALLIDIENSLNVEKKEIIDHKSAQNEDSIDKYLSYYKSDDTLYLSENMIFKIIIICLMKRSRIQAKDPNEIHGVTAFVLAVFSQLLQFVVMRLQESLLDLSIENKTFTPDFENDISNEEFNQSAEKDNNNGYNDITNDTDKCINQNGIEINGNHVDKKIKKFRDKSKSLLTKLRRPRNRKNSSDSDMSDIEISNSESSSDDNINSDVSETEEDIMSDENALSDDALSEEDILSGEEQSAMDKKDEKTEEMNGHVDQKIVIENENEVDYVDSKDNHSKEAINTSSPNLDENCPSANTLTHVAQKEKQNLDPIKVLKVLNEEKTLISIKVCCDWLQGHQEIIRTCAKGSKTLLKRLSTLFNLINVDAEKLLKKREFDIFSSLEQAKDAVENVPLPEDIDLRGLNIFEDSHKCIDWEVLRRKKLTDIEETLLRALKIVKFGHFLCSVQDSAVEYDGKKNLFVILHQENPNPVKEVGNKNFELDSSKGKLMRHMGKLWLKAEVHALENRLHTRLMSPYLVPDHQAFSKFMPVLKQLVYAKKFIVVVPSIVISALDELKKTSSHAREATRWLESQLQRGSRFLRAQRPHEKLPLPYVKGPKPKEKEAWLYFQIIECCHYLTQQSRAGDVEIPVVTLLAGVDVKKTSTFIPDALANSAGVNFEHIGAFHAKWKSSSKSHG